jgi:hypothetical protein
MFKKVKGHLVSVATNTRAKAAAVGSTAMVAAGSAFAGGGGGFDASAIEAAIDANKTIALGVIGAFILAVWALRSMSLLKRG